MSLKEPSDMGGGRGLRMYGGSEVVMRDGGKLTVQDSSAAENPHLRLYFEKGEHGSPDPHLNLEAVIELRDRLNQAIRTIKEDWGDAVVRAAYKEVARRRAADQEEKPC
ncbi:hypothetical protein SEA_FRANKENWEENIE_136 [Streptomyces phage Frankenweenie]|nr:hypothetical protein SEA_FRANKENWEENIE_136 [Streptomyces phage Frankenweenie]